MSLRPSRSQNDQNPFNAPEGYTCENTDMIRGMVARSVQQFLAAPGDCHMSIDIQFRATPRPKTNTAVASIRVTKPDNYGMDRQPALPIPENPRPVQKKKNSQKKTKKTARSDASMVNVQSEKSQLKEFPKCKIVRHHLPTGELYAVKQWTPEPDSLNLTDAVLNTSDEKGIRESGPSDDETGRDTQSLEKVDTDGRKLGTPAEGSTTKGSVCEGGVSRDSTAKDASSLKTVDTVVTAPVNTEKPKEKDSVPDSVVCPVEKPKEVKEVVEAVTPTVEPPAADAPPQECAPAAPVDKPAMVCKEKTGTNSVYAEPKMNAIQSKPKEMVETKKTCDEKAVTKSVYAVPKMNVIEPIPDAIVEEEKKTCSAKDGLKSVYSEPKLNTVVAKNEDLVTAREKEELDGCGAVEISSGPQDKKTAVVSVGGTRASGGKK